MKIDKEVRHYFKLWQKVEQGYQNVNIDELEFEFVSLENLHLPEKVKIVRDFTAENFIEISDIDEKTKQYDLSNKIKPKLPDTAKQGPKGTILISRVRPLLGSYTIVKKSDDCFTTGDLNPIVLNEEINIDYVFSNICSLNFKNFLIENQNTSGQKPTITSKLYRFEVLLPTGRNSTEWQAVIVEFLRYYRAQFDKYRKLIAQLKSQIESFDKAFLPAIFSAEKDPFIVEYFDQWAKKNNKELSYSSINFEYVSLFKNTKNISMIGSKKLGRHDEIEDINDADGLPVFDASSSILCHISESKFPDKVFEVKDKENPDISFASEGNSSAGTNFHIHKGKYFVNNHRMVVKFLTDKFYSKYVYYRLLNMKVEYGFKRGYIPSQSELKSLDVSLWIPKGDDSFELQKLIVEFIEEWRNWRDEMVRRIEKLSQSIDQAEEVLIAKTFKGCEE